MSDLVKLMLDLVLQLHQKLSLDISHGNLAEFLHSSSLGLLVDFSEFVIEDRRTKFISFLEGFFKFIVGVVLGLQAFVLADVAPSCFNVGDGSLVDGINVGGSQVEKHFTIEFLSVHHLRLNAIDHFSSQLHNLFNEFGSQFF